MFYMGGKAGVAKKFSYHIDRALKETGGGFIEPFVGAFNVIPHLKYALNSTCSDTHPGLISLYRAVQNGFIPPDIICLREYEALRRARRSDAYSTFVSFACSFGGKEWGGYAQGDCRNYALNGKRAIMRKASRIKLCDFDCVSYHQIPIPKHQHVYYCDPPYMGTTGYRDMFDSGDFFFWCQKIVEHGHIVFVSESNAPSHWKILWETERPNSLNTERIVKERLYKVSVG